MNTDSREIRMTLFSLCLLIFIDSIGIGLIYPVMPKLFLDPINGLLKGTSFFSRDMLYGIAFSVFPLMGFFSMPLFGAFSDSFGRRRMLLIGVGGLVLSYALTALSVLLHSYSGFIIGRIVGGISIGTFTIANASVADISHDAKNKLKNFRWPILASVGGYILGPAISSLLDFIYIPFKLTAPFIIATILSFINWIMLFQTFKETRETDTEKRNLINECKEKLSSIFFVIKENRIRSFVISCCFLYFGFGLVTQTISLYLAKFFNYTPGAIGVFFIIMGLVMSFSSFCIQPLLYNRFDYRKLIFINMVLMGILLLFQFTCSLIYIKESLFTIWFVSVLSYIALPFVTLGYTTLFSELISKDNQGKIMGGLGQVYSAMFFISALFIGYLMSGHESLVFLFSGLSILIASVIFKIKKWD